MDNIFDSILNNETSTEQFFICLVVAFLSGIAYAFLCRFATKSSKSFFITTAFIPASVAVVIMLVNGNIGAGIAVAGAFSLVRFRSAPGSAMEICIIFIAMAAGLAYGMGYLAYGAIFLIIAGIVLIACSNLKILDTKSNEKEKKLTITISEDLDYSSIFDDLFKEYTKSYNLIKVKSINMGSMFKITYIICFKDVSKEKEFIDKLRCRNGNLEILLERLDYLTNEL